MFDSPTQAFHESLATTRGPQGPGQLSLLHRSASTVGCGAARHRQATELVPKSDMEFKALYDTHFRLVRCALTRLGVREPDVKDMAQKVFLVAFLKLPEFEGRSLLSTWLWGICRRVAIAYRRSGAMRHEVATDPFLFEESLEQRGVVEAEPGSSHDVAVEHLLSKLSESQRVVFKLAEVDDLDGPQIAKLLNVSLGTVRSRLRYARQRIRREVKRLTLASAFNKKAQVPRIAKASTRTVSNSPAGSHTSPSEPAHRHEPPKAALHREEPDPFRLRDARNSTEEPGTRATARARGKSDLKTFGKPQYCTGPRAGLVA